MIELMPTTALMLYLCLTLTVLLGLWGYHHHTSKKKKISLVSQELVICEYCQFAYLSAITKTVNKCPQCGAYNKNNPYKNLS